MGSREIGFTILSMTLSLVAVFIPVLFMGGLVGRLFHEFAVTIGVADPGVGLRVAHAHADAVQPLPQAEHGEESHGRFFDATESAYSGCSALLRAHACAGRWTTGRDALRARRCSCSAPRSCSP